MQILTAAVVLVLSQNPYRDARVGDWVEWRGDNGVVRHTATAIEKGVLIVRVDWSQGGVKKTPTEMRIELARPFPRPLPPDPDLKVVKEVLGSGRETLTIEGKRYECEWVRRRSTTSITGEPDQVSVSKEWRCRDVPLSGAVRVESEQDGVTTVMQLSGFGRQR